jgi:hypothetical protein
VLKKCLVRADGLSLSHRNVNFLGTPLGRGGLVSLLVLIPCFWQNRIQAGDLSSHIYNSWLAQQIEQGKAPGLSIARQSSNVLFDLILSVLFRFFGAQAAQHIAVSAAVLMFFWGAFALIHAVNGRAPWFLTPCLAMLAYGWTFQSGLFNFYLSAGLGLWSMALLWHGGRARQVAAAALMGLAYVAHGIGFCWAAGAMAYAWISSRTAPRYKPLLPVVTICAVIALRFVITSQYQTFWSPHQWLEASAIDQVWTYGLKYIGVSVVLGLLWSFLFLRLSHQKTYLEIIGGLPFQISLITAAGIFLIPTRIELHGFNAALSFITERMTLLLAAAICVLLGSVKPAKWEAISFLALAGVYFSFLYVDTKALNAAEDQVDAAIAQIPPGQRVFSSFSGGNERVILWPHAADRACIGRCVSYNNYEPHSGAFRIRAALNNAIVVAIPAEHYALRYGGYVVKPQDVPLYQIQLCGVGAWSVCVSQLKAGETTKGFESPPLPLLW